MAKYQHWLERADVTVLHTDGTLLQLQSTHPRLFTTVLRRVQTVHDMSIDIVAPQMSIIRWRLHLN